MKNNRCGLTTKTDPGGGKGSIDLQIPSLKSAPQAQIFFPLYFSKPRSVPPLRVGLALPLSLIRFNTLLLSQTGQDLRYAEGVRSGGFTVGNCGGQATPLQIRRKNTMEKENTQVRNTMFLVQPTLATRHGMCESSVSDIQQRLGSRNSPSVPILLVSCFWGEGGMGHYPMDPPSAYWNS